jgi:hypothetical protein
MKGEKQTYESTLIAESIEKKRWYSWSKRSCMWPAGNSENFNKMSRNNLRITYNWSGVAFECAGVYLHSALIDINSSGLQVVCPPPGIGTQIEIVL